MAATNHAPAKSAKAKRTKRTIDPISDSLRYPLVICFGKSTSAGYPTAVLHARLLKDYTEQTDAGTLHYCRISSKREEFARAAAIIDLLRLTRSLSVYSNGSPVRNLHELAAVLNCYLQAEGCNDHTAHCHVVDEVS